jgi:Tol biopolymer transport system component
MPTLAAGEKLGPYEILAPIGAGGMGEVYRARDTKLKRDVALKVLPDAFARDPGRMARFQREAEVLASLNHPNIAHIYGVEERALVMELVEGESPKGPLPFEDAWNIALQIADALEYAHDRGVIHRDLKPANVKVTPDGVVKLLDFGLAKAFSETPDFVAADPENSPTITLGATVAGTVLGTAAYMSPEQARGKRVDKRADIWSWGVVLYELLTGERLFKGDEAADTLAQVLTKEPDWDRAPARVQLLLQRCLEKDPKKRLRDIGDARLVLESPVAAEAPSQTVPAAQSATARNVAWITAAMFAILAAAALWAPWRTPEPVEPVRFEISAPPKARFTNFITASPDGRKVAFTALDEAGQVGLWVRPLDGLEAKPLTNTAMNPVPFWSPDSRYIAYQLDGKLRKIAVSGGSPEALCDAPVQFEGGAWNQDDVIVFGGPEGLLRVSAAGGVPQKLTSLDTSKKETGHAAPQFLPDGRHFVYLRRSLVADNSGIFVGSIDDAPGKQAPHRILANALNALYAPPVKGNPGYLLFVRENALMAQPFDAGKLELTGEAAPVSEPVGLMAGRFVNAAVSANGVLLYRATVFGPVRQLAWFERGGKTPHPVSTIARYLDFTLSPDGMRAAVAINDVQQNNPDLWIVDLARGLRSRFTFDKAGDRYPVWSPDGDRIVFSSNREGVLDLYWKPSNGATHEELLLKSSDDKIALDWSRDGKYLLYKVLDPKTSSHLWYLPMKETERKPVRFLANEASQGRFSPDGRFVAYTSNEYGAREVFVRTFPDPGGRWQVSKNGGSQPHWRRDGKELFYLAAGFVVTSVDVITGATFQPGDPKPLFDAGLLGPDYDVTGDGKRFLALGLPTEGAVDLITVVLNWQVDLKK